MINLLQNWLTNLGRFVILMGRTFSMPERFRMFWKQYVKEMAQLGVNSIGIVLLISFFIGAVICIQMKLNIQSPWMPRWVSGYTTYAAGVLIEYHVSDIGRQGGLEYRFGNRNNACHAADRRSRHHGCQLGLLPYSAEDIRYAHHHAAAGYLLIGNGYRGRLRYSVCGAYHRARRLDAGLATLLPTLVCLDEYHQESLLCLYHQRSTFVFWLYRRGRKCECG